MHTPRLSGQPCSAGDFVFARICSRPFRTSCANVGTALPQSSITFRCIPRGYAPTRGVSRVGQQKGSVTTPAGRQDSLHNSNHACKAAGQSGENYSALRGWRPIPAALLNPVPHVVVPGQENLPHYLREKTPSQNRKYMGKRLPCQSQFLYPPAVSANSRAPDHAAMPGFPQPA
jgi:hypothetical protein